MKKYNIIYADPPWKFKNNKTGGSMKSGAAAKYPVMDVENIKALPVNEIAEDNCVLFMWWVGSQPQEALDTVKAWGFTIKTMTGFNWVKLTKKNRLPYFGMGHWTRAGSECCLIAVKGKNKRISARVRSVRNVQVGVHSAKPGEFRDDIVELCGDISRVELFARDRAFGWDAWGKDIESNIVGNLPAFPGKRPKGTLSIGDQKRVFDQWCEGL